MEELLKDQLGHLDLTGRVIKTEKHAHGGGGFGDVWRGRSGPTEVAIKIPKLYERNDDQPLEMVAKVHFLLKALYATLITLVTGGMQRDTHLVTTLSYQYPSSLGLLL